jgi:predicted Fe-S protein YdhL (DUF1289 family)
MAPQFRSHLEDGTMIGIGKVGGGMKSMAIFPKIQSPCPYKNQLSSIMDGDTCRMCKRQVFDLSDMTDDERVAFMKGCGGEVCVSYSLRPALAAAAVAIAAIAAPTVATACDATDPVVVFVGGIKDPANVQYVQDSADSEIPVLPVVYEDKQKTAGDGTAPAVSSPPGS